MSKTIELTDKQRELLRLVEYRRRHGMPTVQRDLAEHLGIRRDSLNKLLARTRKVLAREGRTLEMPLRSRQYVTPTASLADLPV